MKKGKMQFKKSNLTLECDEPEDQFLQTNFTKLDAECVQFLREDISVSARGMIHKSRTSRSIEKQTYNSSKIIKKQADNEERPSKMVKRDICKEDIQFFQAIGKGAGG